MDMKHTNCLFELYHRKGNKCLACSKMLGHLLAVLTFNNIIDFANSMHVMHVLAGLG